MANRPKLGLALSGGGFRASLFHLGVLRRLAELDLLRHVSALSTVSGGSIVGALYMIHLAKNLKKSAQLSRGDYLSLVSDVRTDFRAGTAANLRTRLLLDPLQNLRMWCTTFSMGRRMARLYHQHLFRKAAVHVRDAWAPAIPLDQFRIEPGGKPIAGEIEAYNAANADRLPKWVINATSLNTGRPFRFSPSEVGDPVLGSLRFDDVDNVLAYKALLLSTWSKRGTIKTLNRLRDQELANKPERRERTSRQLAWWLAVERGLEVERGRPADAKAVDTAYRERLAAWKGEVGREASWLDVLLEADWDAARRLATADFNPLRRAKVAAWYLTDGARREPPVTGGATRDQHAARLWDAIEDIDVLLAARLKKAAPTEGQGLAEIAELCVDLFYFRSARAFGWGAGRAIQRLTVSEAVAASANFPPVFAPFEIIGLYDPGNVWRLSLTDGGVHDNSGVDALQDEECTHIIASDAGGLLHVDPRPGGSRLIAMMPRIMGSLMNTVRDHQLDELRERRRVNEAAAEATFCKGPAMMGIRARYRLESLSFFHMTSNPNDGAPDGPAPHPLAEDIALLRTDLDAFHKDEMDALEYQGHQLADRFVRRWIGKAFTCDTSPSKLPPLKLPTGAALDAARRTLRAGRQSFLRPLALHPWLAALVGLLGLAGFGALFWFVRFPVAGVAAWVLGRIAAFVRWPLLFGDHRLWLEHPRSGWVLLGGAGAFALLWTIWPRVEMAMARALSGFGPRGIQVGAIHVTRFVGLWRRNVWWVLGYLPAVMSLVGSALAAASYGVYRATRGK